MEILEVLWALVQGCGCFLEVAAATSNVGAGVAGYKAVKERKARRRRLPPDRVPVSVEDPPSPAAETPPRRSFFWAFVILLCVGAFLTALTIWKWLR